MFGALMQAGNLGLPREAYGDAFSVTFAKKPKLIPDKPGDPGGGGPGGGAEVSVHQAS